MDTRPAAANSNYQCLDVELQEQDAFSSILSGSGRAPIREIGTVEPNQTLLQFTVHPDFKLGSFGNFVRFPTELVEPLRVAGYQVAPFDSPIVFGSNKGVKSHRDYQLTALWTLRLPTTSTPGHKLVVEDVSIFLREGQLLLFDATRAHKLITRNAGFWAVLSAYMEPLPSSDRSEG